MIEVTERPKVPEVPVDELNRTIDCFAKQTYDVPPELTVIGSGDFAELAAIAGQLEIEASAENFGCFRMLSQKDGDKRVVWCRRVIAEIRAAKQMFLDLISKGMIPYKVGVDGQASVEEMKEFDPTAEEVIFMPIRAIAGG
ncbi:hypothetical protein LCGC14_2387580 [marine sediment metagenome]|uniref:Uncharacterized protein n=1 Tax=marine sediment metagenome TaxID=412755 RepID=A0A0F9CLA7_9ZZZZ